MKIAILQPGYLPWLGFFDQLARTDRFVFYDDVQFTRRDWRTRNRIRNPNAPDGWQWLTVPVKNRGNYAALVNEIEIDHETDWPRKHLNAIRASYARAPFFKTYFSGIEDALGSRPTKLIDLDVALTRRCAEWLGISTPVLFSSELGIGGQSTERLVSICAHLGADAYLTGNAAREYLDEERFRAENIRVEWHDYAHPTYRQAGAAEFMPYMCVLDVLFNCGPESLSILTNGRASSSLAPGLGLGEPTALELLDGNA